MITAKGADSKSDKVYHLVGNLLKVPFWDRVQKNRVLSGFTQKKWIGLHEAALDGILLRYRRVNPSGSRVIEECMLA